MRKQRGQSAIEFALMAPIIFMMIFGMIYGGIMFMQYMHYSNAVRTAARQIAVVKNTTQRESMRKSQEDWLKQLWNEEVNIKFYTPTPTVTLVPTEYTQETVDGVTTTTIKGQDVVVNVTFEREENLPLILEIIDFPPKTIKTIEYRMRVELQDDITKTTTNEET